MLVKHYYFIAMFTTIVMLGTVGSGSWFAEHAYWEINVGLKVFRTGGWRTN